MPPRPRPPGAFRRDPEGHSIDTSSDAILYALFIELPLHLYHLAILVIALSGSLVLQCLMLGWIALYYAQVRVFLLSARVLREAFPDGPRLAVRVRGGKAVSPGEENAAGEQEGGEQESGEQVVTARMLKEEAARLRREKPVSELPVPSVNPKGKASGISEPPRTRPKPTKPTVAAVPKVDSTLDKLRNAARAAGARRGQPARSYSPVSDPEPENVNAPQVDDLAQLGPDGMLDWAGIAAREAASSSNKPELSQQPHDDYTHFVDEQDDQPKQKQENDYPPRPVLRLPNDRPPRSQPSVASTKVDKSYAQAIAAAPPAQPSQTSVQPLNRSSAFTEDQLAAAREFMSGATRGNAKSSSRRSNATHLSKPPQKPGAQYIHQLKQQGQMNRKLKADKALAKSQYAPAKPIERPAGWVPPHLAASTAKAPQNPASAHDDGLKDASQADMLQVTSRVELDWEDEDVDGTTEVVQPVNVVAEPEWENDGHHAGEAARAPAMDGEPAPIVDDTATKAEPATTGTPMTNTTTTEPFMKPKHAADKDLVQSEKSKIADVYDTLFRPEEDEEFDQAPKEAEPKAQETPLGCSPSRLRLFAKGDGNGDFACAMCDKNAVQNQEDVCFPCSTVADRIVDVTELLTPYSEKNVAQKLAAQRQAQKQAMKGRSGSRRTWTSTDVEGQFVDGDFTLVTVGEPEASMDQHQPDHKDTSYEHPDLFGLNAGSSDNKRLDPLPNQTPSQAQHRKLSANAVPFFAPRDKAREQSKLASITNRNDPGRHEQATTTSNPYTAFFETFTKTPGDDQEPRSRSSLSESRWAPKNLNNSSPKVAPAFPRFVVRRTPHLENVFGPALSKSQSDPAQLSPPVFPRTSHHGLSQGAAGNNDQLHNVTDPSTGAGYPVFSTSEGLQSFDPVSMKLPPGLPVPDHVKRSIRLSKAIPIRKPVETSEHNASGQLPSPSGDAARKNTDSQPNGVDYPSMTATELPGIGKETKTNAGADETDRPIDSKFADKTRMARKASVAEPEARPVAGPVVEHRGNESVHPIPAAAPSPKAMDDDDNNAKTTAITKPNRLRKIAREAIRKSLRQRDTIRLQLLGSWNLERAQEYALATEHYNDRREELVVLSLDGKLSDADLAKYPKLSSKDLKAPNASTAKLRNASAKPEPNTARASPAASTTARNPTSELDSSSPEAALIPDSAQANKDIDEPALPNNATAAQIEAQTRARAAYNLLVAAITAWSAGVRICLKCKKGSCGDHQSAKGKSRIGPAKTNYRRRREALVQVYGGKLPTWLADELPDPQALELKQEKDCCVM